MQVLKILFILLVCKSCAFGQAPSVEIWDKRFGGNNDDEFFSFQQTNDGGYILGGQSISPVSGDKTQDCRGGYDYWVVKMDAFVHKQWDVRFGTDGNDLLWVVQQTIDGGYILGGFTGSDPSYDKTTQGWGGADYWLVKIDSVGNKQWDKDYGGNLDDGLYTLKQTKDGGYILGGLSYSGISGDKTEDNWDTTYSEPDQWIIKIDSVGNKQWDKRFGGLRYDDLESIIQTNDGGYLLGGTTESDSGDDISQRPRGAIDYWVVKIDSLGKKQWDKRFGGQPGSESSLNSVVQSLDGGYMLGGFSTSDSGGDKTQNAIGYEDYWIIKIDSLGNKQWDKDIGAPGFGELVNIALTFDGGYLLSGTSEGLSAGGDKTQVNMGLVQVWIVKTDSLGNKQWDKTILNNGGNNYGYAIQTDSDCFVIASQTDAGIGGYKTQPNWNGADSTDDYWIVKFCFSGIGEGVNKLTTNLQFNVYPNPFCSELDITLAEQNLHQATFTITNLLGKTMYAQNETNLNPTYTKMLDLSYLPNGVYWVSVVVDGERVTKEIIKQ